MRRKHSRNLAAGTYFDTEMVNPTEGLINLADVMLVFAVGLMVSIVIAWNVNILEVNSVANSQQEVEDTQYEEVQARVFRDAKTGKLYIVEGGEKVELE